MSDTSETDIIKTEKGKRIKRGPTSLHIDMGLWQEVRIMAVLKGKSVTDYVERALRKQIDEDNREAGRQGYKVGQGGMYIPPPSSSTQQPQPQSQQEISRELAFKGFGLVDKLIRKTADEHGISRLEAARKILDDRRKDLLKNIASEIGTEDKYVLLMFIAEIDSLEKIERLQEEKQTKIDEQQRREQRQEQEQKQEPELSGQIK